MLAAFESNDARVLEDRRSELITHYNRFDAGWMEKPYSIHDLNHGSYGAVTTALAFYGLLITDGKDLFKDDQQSEVSLILHTVADRLYSYESNGFVLKSRINRSRVYNTDLLVGSVIGKYVGMLPARSVRKRLFVEMIRRIVYRAIVGQLPSGAFRYHSLSLDCPLLYQAMCISLLSTLAQHTTNEELVTHCIAKGFKWLDQNTRKDGLVMWHKSKSRDKVGSCWIYGWTIPIYIYMDPGKSAHQIQYLMSRFNLLSSLGEDGSQVDESQPQELYLALSAISLHLCRENWNSSMRFGTVGVRTKLITMILEARSCTSFVLTLIRQSAWKCRQTLVFRTGALENESW